MRRWTNEIIVGTGIMLAIAIGIYGYVYLRDLPVRQQGYKINILFKNVTGLQTGDAITVSGLKVGRILEMKLDREHVNVRAWMNGQVPFPNDSRAAIRSVGMIGEKYIDLMPGTASVTLQEDDTITGEYISDIADAGGSLSELMSQTNALLAKLNTAVDSAFSHRSQKAIAAMLINTEDITRQVNMNLEGNMRHLKNTMAYMDSLSSGLNTFWQQRQSSIDSVSQNLATTTAQLPTTLAKLDSALTETRKLLAAVEQQKGAVGKALYDDELYTKANQTVTQLQTILDDVKKNPSKYLQISMIHLF
ncbi:MCE family protein [candidate division KSB1 bacterium]|nr:MCE family protein [candidate division KSB1 bacterium]